MLGAKAIHLLAGEAEAACVAGEVDLASDLAASLAALLQRLKECAAPALNASYANTKEEVASGVELEPQALTDLVGLLRQQSLSAMDRFRSISPQLRRLLSTSSYELVRDHIDNLQFSDAATALEESQR